MKIKKGQYCSTTHLDIITCNMPNKLLINLYYIHVSFAYEIILIGIVNALVWIQSHRGRKIGLLTDSYMLEFQNGHGHHMRMSSTVLNLHLFSKYPAMF